VNIFFTTGVKFCTQQTIIPKEEKNKKRRVCEHDMKNLALGSGACGQENSTGKRRIEF
jgi:hypothetical protein